MQYQEGVVVPLVVGICERDVRYDLDTVGHEVVESHTCAETVELLLDDRTCLMVVASTDTEVCLLTTTGK